MISSIEQYLSELKKELSGCDRATIQDALSDAEEYLRTSLNSFTEANSQVSTPEALSSIIEKYGAPGEVATAYRDIEARTPAAFTGTRYKEIEPAATDTSAPSAPADTRPLLVKFFGIYADPRA